jgi:serine/threonine-protein kinase
MIGRTISRYQILEKLGEGGMGSVWLAEDPLLERKVAMKFLSDKLGGGGRERRNGVHRLRARGG